MKKHKALTNQSCGTCRKYRTTTCESRKYNNVIPQEGDWCAAWRGLKNVELNMVDYANRLLGGCHA